jgi:ribosomal protein L11 methyltransferase
MREVVLTVPRDAVEDVLDRLLPIVPSGVRAVPRGPKVELTMRGAELPSLAEVAACAGRWPHKLAEREASDDWVERRLADYEPDPISGRLVVRPEWAPVPAQGLIDIVLTESAAFGAGSHPTTWTCLELLLERRPSGSFADLGCGTGVLAILAARLGWSPVIALDVQPESVEAALANAAANGVDVQASHADLASEPPPAANAFAANVPAPLHELVAAAMPDPVPRFGLLSGFSPEEAGPVIDAYAARGLREARRVERHGWVVATVERD